MKSAVLAAIGEATLAQPAAVNAALAANDRVKYAFTLLQGALAHADHPAAPADSLRRERLACGIEDPALDDIVPAARRQGAATLIPGAAALLARVAADMQVMAAPVLAAGRKEFAPRLETLLATLPADDLLDQAAVAAITQARTGGPDSLHRLVMDLHKQLNALQAALAQETLDGAAVYGLADEDRPRVLAFMAGPNRTAKLKGDHPGLATTATRCGPRLVIQNDIGTTDAHVLVVHVEGLTTTVTYTDVHPERLAFFQSLLDRFKPVWQTARKNNHPGQQEERI